MKRRPNPRIRVVAFVVGLAAVAAACGVSTDSKPRAVNRDQVSDLVAPSTSTPASDQAGTQRIRLYFVCSGRITELPRQALSADPRTVIVRLLAGPTDQDRSAGYATFIPPNTRLLSLDLTAAGTLVIQLSKEMDALSGQSAKTAYAQLVFTATGTPDVKSVEFATNDNTFLAVPTDSVNKKVVSRADYSQALSSGNSTSTTGLSCAAPSP